MPGMHITRKAAMLGRKKANYDAVYYWIKEIVELDVRERYEILFIIHFWIFVSKFGSQIVA